MTYKQGDLIINKNNECYIFLNTIDLQHNKIKEYTTYFEVYDIRNKCFDMLDNNKKKINWDWISVYQTLSKSFIEKYKDKVDWYCISRYQTLSESFIEKYKNKVNWYCISQYQTLSKEFKKKYMDKLSC